MGPNQTAGGAALRSAAISQYIGLKQPWRLAGRSEMLLTGPNQTAGGAA